MDVCVCVGVRMCMCGKALWEPLGDEELLRAAKTLGRFLDKAGARVSLGFNASAWHNGDATRAATGKPAQGMCSQARLFGLFRGASAS